MINYNPLSKVVQFLSIKNLEKLHLVLRKDKNRQQIVNQALNQKYQNPIWKLEFSFLQSYMHSNASFYFRAETEAEVVKSIYDNFDQYLSHFSIIISGKVTYLALYGRRKAFIRYRAQNYEQLPLKFITWIIEQSHSVGGQISLTQLQIENL